MNCQHLTDIELIERIKENQDCLGTVYKKCKNYSIKFMRKISFDSSVNEEDLNDIYHDAIMILYENILNKNFNLTSSFQTYLNSVCRFQLLNKFKTNQKERNLEIKLKHEYLDYDDSIQDILEPILNQDELEFTALEKAMHLLKVSGGKCYELLVMFWYQRKSMTEISNHFGYTNSANAKNQKSKCQKRLQKEAATYLSEL